MSRIFILSTNTSTEPYPVYPLGASVIASALMAEGHQVLLFDYLAGERSDARLKQSIDDFNPDFIGISIRNIDNVDSLTPESDWFLAEDKRMVQFVRQASGAPIILGGPAFSIMPEEIMDFLEADYGIVGEGEHLICALVRDINKGRSTPRITKSENSFLKGREMCSAYWDKSIMGFYLKKCGIINIQTKRGCPYNCIYCTYPSLEGRHFRVREPEAVVEDVERLKKYNNVDTIFFTDSIFNDPDGHYLRITEKLLLSDMDIRWSGFFRPQGLGRKEIALLKRSGLCAIEAGTDASSDITLSNLRKGFSFDDVLEFNRACIDEEMPTAHYIMFGGPGETIETLDKGLRNIDQLKGSVVFAFSGIRIFPGTGLLSRAIRDGVISENTSLLRPVYYFSPDIDHHAMNASIKGAFKRRRELIFPPSDAQIRIDTMHRFGYRGLLWDMLTPFYRQEKGMEKRIIS